jgi:FMN phosphatase YigB (HAD superfamily)
VALPNASLLEGAVTNGNVCLDRTPSLSALFDFHLSAEDVGAAKPAPAVFQRSLDLAHAALARRVPGCAQLSPAEACFVGDDYTCDVFGSKRAGMLSVWLNHHGGPPPAISADPLAGPAAAAAAVGGALPPPQATEWHDAVISALPELETVLQRWGSPQQA